ncbi:membrane protein insertase YidC [Devriesea agamarum]|uniref:membrane protein insertase YidC n=1 Tax=Devriesea agamarum TaxID=472569 RepID=UPI00071D56C0|nr:membrane protein insertase YidC [Devriesea agamarum]
MNPLYPIEWAVAWIMVQFHAVLSVVLDPDSGLTWLLSIVGLTAVIRILIIPLFVKQIRASRAMQLVSPEIQAIQKKYKGKTDPASRQAMTQETMAVYREAKANPFSSCLPVLLQMPIFFALFRVLFYQLPGAAQPGSKGFGPLTHELAQSAHDAHLFGVGISNSFITDGVAPKIFAGVLIAGMCLVTFFTQKELTMRNMPPTALEGPMANTQKVMLYTLPFIYVLTGPTMPIGVLVYWLTTNVWTLVQQWIVIRNTPTPGSPAEKKRQERINARRVRKGLEPIDFTPKKKTPTAQAAVEPVRVQPVGKKRSKGKKLSDEEKLRRAREARAKAQEERRKQQAQNNSASRAGSGNAGSRSSRKKKK